jgi:uncharacterized surface protein with fasciclin (FAS1) repeats
VSASGLFVVGVLVTLIVAVAMGLLVYAAILDGRAAVIPAGADSEPPGNASANNLLAAACAAGSLRTLVAAIEGAGLSHMLEHRGPFTVFAPNDEAFAQLPLGTVEALLGDPDTLADVVNYHVVPGRMSAADLAGRLSAETLQGEGLVISNNGSVRIDAAHLVSGDVEASNGVIHIIDRVLLPARL